MLGLGRRLPEFVHSSIRRCTFAKNPYTRISPIRPDYKPSYDLIMPKRKASAIAFEAGAPSDGLPMPPAAKRRSSGRKVPALKNENTNPDENPDILDGDEAGRASPDASGPEESFAVPGRSSKIKQESGSLDAEGEETPALTNGLSDSSLSEIGDEPGSPGKIPEPVPKKAKGRAKAAPKAVKEEASATTVAKKAKAETFLDPEGDEDMEADEGEILAASMRPPPVNSDYLPLPWKGRIGYACLNTYLRYSNPPVFASRTCRIASILENRHPLANPDEPPHPTKNRPDREQPADVARGQRYVESIGLANARDCVKMLEWNERYGIRFMRLSSEMFPFASHEEYGYKLAPFAAETLAEVGKIAAKYGHRLTTHPGQFTQLGSPRETVIQNAFRDLEYHEELLSLLKLPEQQNRDAVMIIHLGGVFGDKEATLQRFRENYAKLSDGIKRRLVLENDDVSWCVHELLPICEELNIPFVLDYHHHNIIFDSTQIREGTKDIIDLYPRILATWQRKNITPKMHYSEQTPPAITGTQRRKHSPRVATLPPCPPTMDLMIEAKDKEQAVFELMKVFKLPGFNTFSEIIPHVRQDDNKPVKTPKKKAPKKKGKKEEDDLDEEEEIEEDVGPKVIPEEEVGMGGPEGRVYWPPGMEEWLRPKKRVIKKKEDDTPKGKNKGAKAAADAAADAAKAAAKLEAENKEDANAGASAAATPIKSVVKAKGGPSKIKAVQASAKTATQKRNASTAVKGKKGKKKVESDEEVMSEEASEDMDELDDAEEDVVATSVKKGRAAKPPVSRRASRKKVDYADEAESEED